MPKVSDELWMDAVCAADCHLPLRSILSDEQDGTMKIAVQLSPKLTRHAWNNWSLVCFIGQR